MSEQVILVTGASRGIGLAIATELTNKGHRVFGTSRTPNHTVSYPFEMLSLNVRDNESVQACIEAIIERAGRLDVLVNNAGYDLYGEAEVTSFEQMFGQVDTNFFGSVRTVQAVLPIMRQQKAGKIINVSSIGGLVALPFNSAYAASKFALEGYSEAMRYELLQFGIHTSLVIASGVSTGTLDHSIQAIDIKDSIYHQQRREMVAQMRELSAESNLRPQHLAKQISKIVSVQNPRLRYIVGGQARMLIWMKALLPQNLFERMVINQFSIQTGALA